LSTRRRRAPKAPPKQSIFLLKNLNESIRFSVQGGAQLLEGRNLERSRQLLASSIKMGPENPLPYLLMGDLFDREGKIGNAADNYIKFWDRAQKEQFLMQVLFSTQDREAVAAHVKRKFEQYRMPPPKSDGLQQAPVLMELSLRKKTPAIYFVTHALPFGVILGIPFFIFKRGMSEEKPSVVDEIVFQSYIVLVIAYIIWLVHFLLKAPPLFEPIEWEIISFVLAGVTVVISWTLFGKFLEHRKELQDPSTVFCPHCKRSVLKVVVVCPFCNERLDSN